MRPGISFIVRVRNEERVLGQSLQSLQALTIPHEIVVVLHRCTDGSAEIARSFPGLRIFEFDRPISRAGFETLVTPASSPYSLISFCDWCFSKAEYLWCFKWDADHHATPDLIELLNERSWDDPKPTRIRIPAVSEGLQPQLEPFLFNAGREYAKHIFWEFNKSIFAPDVEEEIIPASITHASRLTDEHMKSYWRERPWFERSGEAEAADLRRKYDALVRLVGPEPLGLARALNPICDEYETTVRLNEAKLDAEGISLWR